MASGKLTAEDDPEIWARAFNQFTAANNVAFEDVAAWFHEAIMAGKVKGYQERKLQEPKWLKNIEAMQGEVLGNNVAHGWFDEPVSFGDCMMNLAGEVSEAWEAWRKWGLDDMTTVQGDGMGHVNTKPEGVGSEFADIFIRLLDNCERFGINLREEYERKMTYNMTRSYRHGEKRA